MINHDLSPEAVNAMARVDLANATEEPASPIGQFDFHDCVCGIGAFVGRPPWEQHTAGDELLHVLSGESELTILEGANDVTRVVRAGECPGGQLAGAPLDAAGLHGSEAA